MQLCFTTIGGKEIPAAHTEIWIATSDWKSYYRNLLKPVDEWWQQILWLDTAGVQIDLATCFGFEEGYQTPRSQSGYKVT